VILRSPQKCTTTLPLSARSLSLFHVCVGPPPHHLVSHWPPFFPSSVTLLFPSSPSSPILFDAAPLVLIFISRHRCTFPIDVRSTTKEAPFYVSSPSPFPFSPSLFSCVWVLPPHRSPRHFLPSSLLFSITPLPSLIIAVPLSCGALLKSPVSNLFAPRSWSSDSRFSFCTPSFRLSSTCLPSLQLNSFTLLSHTGKIPASSESFQFRSI